MICAGCFKTSRSNKKAGGERSCLCRESERRQWHVLEVKGQEAQRPRFSSVPAQLRPEPHQAHRSFHRNFPVPKFRPLCLEPRRQVVRVNRILPPGFRLGRQAVAVWSFLRPVPSRRTMPYAVCATEKVARSLTQVLDGTWLTARGLLSHLRQVDGSGFACAKTGKQPLILAN